MKEYLFYDTSSLLVDANLFDPGHEPFIISSVSLDELNKLKASNNKTPELRMTAQAVLKKLATNRDKYTVWTFKVSMLNPIVDKDLEINNDIKLCN